MPENNLNITELANKCDQSCLDDMIDDAMGYLATKLNNQGRESQVQWLLANGATAEQIFETAGCAY